MRSSIRGYNTIEKLRKAEPNQHNELKKNLNNIKGTDYMIV